MPAYSEAAAGLPLRPHPLGSANYFYNYHQYLLAGSLILS